MHASSEAAFVSAAASAPPSTAPRTEDDHSAGGRRRSSRIRFIHNYFHPDLSSVSQVITDVAGWLAARGHIVSVIASRNEYAASGSRLPRRGEHQGVRIRRTWGPSFGRESRAGYVIDQLSFMIGGALAALTAPRADAVVILTNPPFFGLLGTALRALRRERFVHVVMDLYPDVAIQHGVLRDGSLLARLLHRLTRFTLRGADGVVVLGECMRDRVLEYGVDEGAVTIVRNWADSERLRPVPRTYNAFREELGIERAFVVMYSGNMGVAHRFDDILEVARRLQDHPDLLFLFIGDGPRRREIERFRSRYELRNVRVLDYQPHERLAMSLAAGDVHFVSLREGFEGAVVPSKAYGVMATGRPIVYQGAAAGEIARMIQDHGIGVVVAEGDVDALEASIRAMYGDRELADGFGRAARHTLTRWYDREEAMRAYERVLVGVPNCEG